MGVIDRDHNTRNAYGNVRVRNSPRVHKQRNGTIKTSRAAPSGLLVNFYNTEWLSKLNSH